MSKPHTCPTCGGTGQRLIFYTIHTRCESCNGSGIVWEPSGLVEARESVPPSPSTPSVSE